MKLELEPTTQIVTANGCRGRVWTGVTDHGVQVQAVILSVACPLAEKEENERFFQELSETTAPCPEPRAFDMRFVL